MRENEWHRMRASTTHMEKVDAKAVNRCAVLRIGVEMALLESPVESGLPVANNLSQVGQIRSLAPAITRYLISPACQLKTPMGIVKISLRNVNRSGLHLHKRGPLLRAFVSGLSVSPIADRNRSDVHGTQWDAMTWG
jgi:hypothetical protein